MLLCLHFRWKASIHQQIILLALAPSFVIALLLIFLLYENNLQHNESELQQQGEVLIAQLAGALEYPLAVGASEQLPIIIETTIKPATIIMGIAIQTVIILNSEGKLLHEYSGSPSSGGSENIIEFSKPIKLQKIPLKTNKSSESRILGYVTVRLSLLSIQLGWRKRLIEELSIVFIVFTITITLAYVVGCNLSNTIIKIAHTIQCIKNGKDIPRLSETSTNELGILQQGINLLADTLESSHKKLNSELNKAHKEYQNTLEALEQANQAKSLFLARISHEMRTPMYSILGLLEQLFITDRDIAERRILEMIQTAASTLNRHIDDILDVTQLAQLEKEGQNLPNNEAVNPWALVEMIVGLQQTLMNERDLYLDIIVTPQVPSIVRSNNKAFQEIISNLLGNAVKYTQHGGIIIWLEVGFRVQPTLRLRIADTGCGIPENRLESIFREFEQVDEAYNRRHGGTGLGLSFVKKNCTLLGGYVTVTSTLEHGSTFTVELPIQLADDLTSGRNPNPQSLPSHWRGLVVDERATFRSSVTSRFQSLRIPVEEQAISLTALAATRPPGPLYDLLIVQNLHKQSESSLLNIIKGLKPWANLLISLESTYSIEIQRSLQDAGVEVILWVGATREHIQVALLDVVQQGSDQVSLAPMPLTRSPLAGRKILVVEDFEINRAIIVNQLLKNGATVLEAEDGDSAILQAAEPALDLILIDIQMPGKDGITAIQEIRRLSSGAHLPILGFTASVDKPTQQRILKAGADGVLNKPISETDLIQGICQTIQKVASRPWRLAHQNSPFSQT